MKRLFLLLVAVFHHFPVVNGEGAAHRVEQALISRFTAEGEIPTFEEMMKTVGHFIEPKMHHLNDKELEVYLLELAADYPHLTQLYKIGESVNGADLRVLIVSKYPEDHEKGIPEFKYVANMHGDETAGRVFLAKLAWILLHNYGTNDYITRLVNTTRIHIMPTMNPDGYETALTRGWKGRQNANGIDLNRNFPSRFKDRIPEGGEIQPEAQAIMDWSRAIPFVLSANLHGGTNIVNYPWDDHENSTGTRYNPCPDNDLFVRIAYSYARSNSRIWKKGPRCLKNDQIDDLGALDYGITNGANWYQVENGMQDWLYVNTNSFDVTVEISCEKFPNEKIMEILWDESKYSLLEHIQQVHNAIHGEIIDATTGLGITNVTVRLDKGGKDVYSYGDGEFWRLANLGNYTLTFSHPDYKPADVKVAVTLENRSPKIIVRLDPKNIPIVPIKLQIRREAHGQIKGFSVIKSNVSLKNSKSVAYVAQQEGIIIIEKTAKSSSSWLLASILLVIVMII